MGHGQDSTRVIGQVLLQPLHGLGVQVVRRLVEQQQVRLGEQELSQRYTTALATRKVGHRGVGRRAAQSFHGLLDLGINLPSIGGVQLFLQLAHLFHELIAVVGGHFLGDLLEALLLFKDIAQALFDVAAHGLLVIERRLLLQDAHGGTWIQESLAVGRLVQAGHNLQNGGLTGTVRADHTNLGTWVERHCYIVKDDFIANCLAHVFHRVDEFAHFYPFAKIWETYLSTQTLHQNHRPSASGQVHPRRSSRWGNA